MPGEPQVKDGTRTQGPAGRGPPHPFSECGQPRCGRAHRGGFSPGYAPRGTHSARGVTTGAPPRAFVPGSGAAFHARRGVTATRGLVPVPGGVAFLMGEPGITSPTPRVLIAFGYQAV